MVSCIFSLSSQLNINTQSRHFLDRSVGINCLLRGSSSKDQIIDIMCPKLLDEFCPISTSRTFFDSCHKVGGQFGSFKDIQLQFVGFTFSTNVDHGFFLLNGLFLHALITIRKRERGRIYQTFVTTTNRCFLVDSRFVGLGASIKLTVACEGAGGKQRMTYSIRQQIFTILGSGLFGISPVEDVMSEAGIDIFAQDVAVEKVVALSKVVGDCGRVSNERIVKRIDKDQKKMNLNKLLYYH